MQKRLQEARCFTIDADKIAEGLLEMFTDDERVVLRFGMLPAEKMESLKRIIRERFEGEATMEIHPKTTLGGMLTWDKDSHTAYAKRADGRPGVDIIDFSMNKLVAEAVHEVCLALYKIGDLVV
jgi:hypothetical protein